MIQRSVTSSRLRKQLHVSSRKVGEGVKRAGFCLVVACCAQDVEDAWSQERVMERVWSGHFGLSTQGRRLSDVESFMASRSLRVGAVEVCQAEAFGEGEWVVLSQSL